MKKIFCLTILVCFTFALTACDHMDNIVLNNMSDLRINYFAGQNDNFYVNLSCGYREEYFAYDGNSTTPKECGVITLGFFGECSYNSVAVNIKINNDEKEYVLEKSPYENVFMADIEKIVNENNVYVCLKNSKDWVELKNLSNDWKINYKQALKLTSNYFKQQLNDLYFNNKLNAECYLKVITKQDSNYSYYYFSIIDIESNNYSCLIDVNTGEIISNFKRQ